MASALRPSPSPGDIDQWCRSLLGDAMAGVHFESGYSSAVFGLELVSGIRVVVKARPWSPRLQACTEVQRRLARDGFRCPAPLRGPVKIDGLAVSFEEFVEGQPMLDAGAAAVQLAEILAELIDLAPAPPEVPPLPPPYGFLRWPTPPVERLWPPTPEIGVDLNDVTGPSWIDAIAGRIAHRLNVDLPPVVGHGDWWCNNIRWRDGALASVDDWDSVVALPEAAIVGVAAALFADGESTVDQSAAFLDAYSAAAGRLNDASSREVAWAAGLWARLVDARKGIAVGSLANAEALHEQLPDRAHRAGVAT